MNADWKELENVRKKCEELDSELSTFFKSLKEIRDIRDSVSELPEKLKQTETEMENQKKEIENLMSSTSNLLITFEEQAKGLFFDLEKKTENLAGEVKTSISDLKNIFELNNTRVNNEQKEKLQQIAGAYEHIRSSFEDMGKVVDSHGQSLNALKDNHAGILQMFEKVEPALKEIQRSVTELQKRPDEVENKLKAMENQLREIFFTKLEKQKHIILAMLVALLASIIFFIFYPR
ncbi:MAG: hypothetical protein HZB61_14960 [Nitrospirae bacterium]|nr:hypothetical protein [Nitrospirota bacterium]